MVLHKLGHGVGDDVADDIDPQGISSILFCVSGGHADCVRAMPYIRATRNHFPNATLAVLSPPPMREIYKKSSFVDLVVKVETAYPSKHATPSAVRELWRTVRAVRGRFDLFIGSPFRPRFHAALASVSRSTHRVGFKVEKMPFAWTRDAGALDYWESLEFRLARLVEKIGVEDVDPALEVRTSEEDEAFADTLLDMHGVRPGDTLVGLHPGTDWTCQQWHPHNWAALVHRLAYLPNFRPVFTGAAEDWPIFENIEKRLHVRPIVVVGQTSEGQLAALVKRFRALVSVDSLAVPLGISAGIPVVALNFRVPSPWSYAQWPNLTALHPPSWLSGVAVNQECRIRKQCSGENSCRSPTCVGAQKAELISALITVDQVLEALAPALTKQRIKRR